MAIQLPMLSMLRKKSSLSSSSSSSTSVSTIMIPTGTPTTSRNNKPISYHLLTIWLDVSRLRLFLLHTIPRYCPANDNLIHLANDLYHSIHSKVFDHHLKNNKKGGDASRRMIAGSHSMTCESNTEPCKYEAYHQELNDCIAIVSTFLSSCIEPLTPQTLSEAHYLIGSINETLHQPEQAKQSYIKALWIIAANSTADIFPTEVLATTLHCLGRTYGVLGKHKEAIRILQKAQQQYSRLNVNKDNAVMIDVQTLIQHHGQRVADIAMVERRHHHKLWSSSLSVSTLTLIVEDEFE